MAAVADKRFGWKFTLAVAFASAAPDLDALAYPLWHIPEASAFGHRGAMHSLFIAVLAGLLAGLFHKGLGVRSVVAAIFVGAATASHGILDMMTDYGSPVAYFWPFSTNRFFADWRPIHSGPLEYRYLFLEGVPRLRSEFYQLILPAFAVATAILVARMLAMPIVRGGTKSRL